MGSSARPANATTNPFTSSQATLKRQFESASGENYIFGNVQPAKRQRNGTSHDLNSHTILTIINNKDAAKVAIKCRRCDSTDVRLVVQ